MKQITTEQIQQIINTLAEFPAKHTYNDIALLQNLPEIKEKDITEFTVEEIMKEVWNRNEQKRIKQNNDIEEAKILLENFDYWVMKLETN